MSRHVRPAERTRIAVVACVGVVCVVLATAGVIAFLKDPAAARDLWPIIASVESAALAVLSALLGAKSSR